MNRLKNHRFYLSGPMEFSPDGGVGYRQRIKKFLLARGAVVIDPTDKPDGGPKETPAEIAMLKEWKANGDWQKVRDYMTQIRAYDLRYVDITDAQIAYVNIDNFMCGTWEEVFVGNKQKKPVILMVEQGLKSLSNWMFGTLPIQLLHESWDSVENYLDYIDTSPAIDDLGRWRFIKL